MNFFVSYLLNLIGSICNIEKIYTMIFLIQILNLFHADNSVEEVQNLTLFLFLLNKPTE